MDYGLKEKYLIIFDDKEIKANRVGQLLFVDGKAQFKIDADDESVIYQKINDTFDNSHEWVIRHCFFRRQCPHCLKYNTTKLGKVRNKSQRYRCRECGKTFSYSK